MIKATIVVSNSKWKRFSTLEEIFYVLIHSLWIVPISSATRRTEWHTFANDSRRVRVIYP